MTRKDSHIFRLNLKLQRMHKVKKKKNKTNKLMTHAHTKSKKICYKRKRNFHTFLNEKMEKIKIRL